MLPLIFLSLSFFFFFNDTATTEIYTLSLHDALPICARRTKTIRESQPESSILPTSTTAARNTYRTSCGLQIGKHTSELQSLTNLVCRLLLEKKKKTKNNKQKRKIDNTKKAKLTIKWC